MSTGDEDIAARSGAEDAPDEDWAGGPTDAPPPPTPTAVASAPDQSGAVDLPQPTVPETTIPGDPPGAPVPVPGTRAGRWWIGVAASLPVFAVVLVFILQNTHHTKISFFSASGNLPVGVALLIASLLGALVVVLLGTARIVQLRRTLRRREAARHPPRPKRFGGRRHPKGG